MPLYRRDGKLSWRKSLLIIAIASLVTWSVLILAIMGLLRLVR